MTGRLSDKVAIITGGGSGIGRSSAELFAREGARVVLAEIDEEAGRSAEEVITAAGGSATFVATDVTSEASVASLLEAVVAAHERVDVLFNCAGGSTRSDTEVSHLSMEALDASLGFDLRSTVLVSRDVIPVMRRTGGSVVNVGSSVALRGGIWPADAYTASKGAIVAVTRSMAANYAQYGIRTNVICPGTVRTERILKGKLGSTAGEEGRLDTGDVDALVVDWSRYPFGIGDPEDIAFIALFLASDESRMINGAIIPADGGLSAY